MSIQEKFLAAVDIIESLPSDGTFQPSEDLMLKLYAYYMQATQGPCRVSKPSVWYYTSRIKWNAWNDLGNMHKELAMEKYVEELTKVIETMSYNENVSKFMSLIGPFYEVVSTEEMDLQHEKKFSCKNPTNYSYPVKKLDPRRIKSEISPADISVRNNSSSPNLLLRSPGSSGKASSKVTLHNISDPFDPRDSGRRPFGTRQDMLILTFINLQHSLEEIVDKLDRLKNLATSLDFKCETRREDVEKVGYRAAAFALFWTLAVCKGCGTF